MAVRLPEIRRESFQLVYDHGSLISTNAQVLDKPSRRFFVSGARYYSSTGLTADGSNFYEVAVQIEGVDVATVDSSVSDFPVNDFVDLAVEASRKGDAGDTVRALITETGVNTLPAGRLVIDCEYY